MFRHRLNYDLDQERFREDVQRSKQLLQNLIGKPVLGYQATSFSVVKNTIWALDIIREFGFMYNYSMFPVKHDIYGIDGYPRLPFKLDDGRVEIPASTLRVEGKNIPIAGGRIFSAFSLLVKLGRYSTP
jgi:hypothetical protein